ncbi:glycerol-3-phosphate dehydrogenase [Fodinicurvata halophila]|uniref:Glycerol-3-phosphate dehydrogenase n=1 Tax=Fodinicurvata halophila TaxID=1419723 RepID=A0ABV8UPQ8_9PROT
MAEASPEIYDLAIIGGGINGCGIARDAAGRGARVFLCEQGDFAGATSSASTKLIHGGLRYLEYYEFRLVREALIEREVLLRAAPHIIWPLRFVLPHHKGLRPAWLIRLGLFFYDHLGGRKILPGTASLDLRRSPVGEPLKEEYMRGFEYSDCWVDDARLVVLNALDALRHGAELCPRTVCNSAERHEGAWNVEVMDRQTGDKRSLRARSLVNAAGPWVSEVLSQRLHVNSSERTRLVKGSHIVVPRLFEHDRAYIFQNSDGRIVFAIPYEQDFTLIGTTDEDFDEDPGEVRISSSETEYLVAAVSEYLQRPITTDDVVHSYSGVRPLYDDGAGQAQQATRDYVLSLDDGEGTRPPLLNVFGGKITTYRKLAEHALQKLSSHLQGLSGDWTASATLPGGDFAVGESARLTHTLRQEYPFLTDSWARRLTRSYGTRTRVMLGDARELADMGQHFGADLYEREVVFLMQEEWARCAEDILWRRSKLGLRFNVEDAGALENWMESRLAERESQPKQAKG